MAHSDYQTPKNQSFWPAQRLPGLFLYSRIILVILAASRCCSKNTYSLDKKIAGSTRILNTLERIGANVFVENMSAFINLKAPCVFVANHMSALEAFILPRFIMPYRKITFVVKKSLTRYPIFKHAINSLDPIVVDRKNPRKDLRAVLDQGFNFLKQNISVLIFPQTTRSLRFDPAQFNTLGIKLAKKSCLPIVPIALKTDAWGMGRLLKDFGKIDPSKPVRMTFGDPIHVIGNGKQAHQEILAFIGDTLRNWGL
ncbi:lysophospholipid acyltransferase family protein [Thermodesulfobacteriota bacterium]